MLIIKIVLTLHWRIDFLLTQMFASGYILPFEGIDYIQSNPHFSFMTTNLCIFLSPRNWGLLPPNVGTSLTTISEPFWTRGKVMTLFSSICVHLLFRIKLLIFSLSFLRVTLYRSESFCLLSSIISDYSSSTLSTFKDIFVITPFSCLLLSPFVGISSSHLDWAILETTDLNLYIFLSSSHLAGCVHLTDPLDFNGFIFGEKQRGEGLSPSLQRLWLSHSTLSP